MLKQCQICSSFNKLDNNLYIFFNVDGMVYECWNCKTLSWIEENNNNQPISEYFGSILHGESTY